MNNLILDGDRLHQIIIEKKLTYQEVSEIAGIPKTTLKEYARGVRSAYAKTIKRLAIALEVSAACLSKKAAQLEGKYNGDELVTTFSQKIYHERVSRGWSQRKLSQESLVPVYVISQIENNPLYYPSPSIKWKLEQALEIS